MTETEQIKALAELDGWTNLVWRDESSVHFSYQRLYGIHPSIPKDLLAKAVPDYLHSRDSIIPLIEKQSETIKSLVWCFLDEASDNGQKWRVWLSPAPEFCKALLRATGKWKD